MRTVKFRGTAWTTSLVGAVCFASSIASASEPLAAPDADAAAAQELWGLSIEELLSVKVTQVQTASKQVESIDDAPASITVITAHDIEAFGGNRLIEVLERVVGSQAMSTFYLRDNHITIRGQAEAHRDRHVLFLIDGRPVRESLTGGQSSPLYMAFPLKRIARIEVIRGPASVLYGTQAFLGTINVITKSGELQSTSGSLTFGPDSMTRAELATGFVRGDFAVALGLNLYSDDGFDWDSAVLRGPPTGARERFTFRALDRGRGADLRLDYKKLTLHATYTDSLQQNATSTDTTLRANQTFAEKPFAEIHLALRRIHANVGYRFDYADGHYGTIDVTFNHHRYWQPLGLTANDVRERGHSNDTLVEYTHHLVLRKDLQLLAGVVLTHLSGGIDAPSLTYAPNGEGIEYNVYAQPKNPRPYVNLPPYSEVWSSAYAQLGYTFRQRVKAYAGAQINKVNGLDPDITPRAGAVITVSKGIDTKLLYGEAFRSPSFFERNFYYPNLGIGNPALGPERIRTAEAIVAFKHGDLSVDLSGFLSWERGVVVRVPAAGKTELEVNQRAINVRGFELEARHPVAKGLFVIASTAYYSLRDENGFEGLFGVPQLVTKLGLAYSWGNRVSIGYFNSFYGHAPSLGPNAAMLNTPVSPHVFGTLRISADVTRIIGSDGSPHVRLFGYGYNIYDASISYPEYTIREINSIPGRRGMSFYGGVDVSF